MKFRVCVAVVCLGLLSACGPASIREETSAQTFEILDVKPPKRFGVDLRNVQTGQVFRQVYVSKRCSTWNRVKVGSHWTLNQTTRHYSDGTSRVHVHVHPLCQR